MLVHEAFSGLSEPTVKSLMTTDPSLSVKTDVTSMIWESLKRYLFATTMSLQGVIVNLMQSAARAGIDL